MLTAHDIWVDVEAVRRHAPLVHNITNYVVMNSTANALLALGASPVMAHAREEVAEMVGIAGALVVNIGTLSPPWVEAMRVAMRAAERRGVPIVLDPVGVGATAYRTETARALIDDTAPTIVRGNASEINALVAAGGATTRGVDSADPSAGAVDAARLLCERYGAVVAVTGASDFVLGGSTAPRGDGPRGHRGDGPRGDNGDPPTALRGDNGDPPTALRGDNGDPLMARVTGLGCTASALCGAFAAVADDPWRAAVGALAVLGICGELAAENAAGPGSLQVGLLDALHGLTADQIADRLKVSPC